MDNAGQFGPGLRLIRVSGADWTVRGYTVEHLVGQGASSEVWRARVTATGEPVALKRIMLGPSASAGEARTEASVLIALEHPHLVRLHEVLPGRGEVVLVLDLAGGGSMAELLERRGRLAPGEVVTTLCPIAAALSYVHTARVVHGDVTPANILFTERGLPLLADLGVARLARVTGQVRDVRSTPAYTDPAVAAGAVPGTPSDVFMLAATALRALTGRTVWPSGTADEALAAAARGRKIDVRAALAEANVPDEMAAVVDRGLSLSPGYRGSAAEFALDLRHTAEPTAVELAAGRSRSVHQAVPAAPAVPAASAVRAHQDEQAVAKPAQGVAAELPPAVPGAESAPVARLTGGGRHAARPARRRVERPRRLKASATIDVAVPNQVAGSVPQRGDSGDSGDSGGFAAPARVQAVAGAPGSSALLTRMVGPRPRPATPAARRTLADRLPAGRRPWLIAGAVALVVIGGTGIGWAAVGGGQDAATGGSSATPSGSITMTTGGGAPAAETGATRTPVTDQVSGGTTIAPVQLDGTTAAGVLADLDALRERAFATRSEVLLTGVYPSGALLTQDTTLLEKLVPTGCGLQGVKTTYSDVTVASRSPESVVVAATATLAQSVLVCDGAATARAPGAGPSPLHITLSWRKSGYLISGIAG
ncbi:MAG: eukaryotic-like serine/threonine-protein kinase [Pseudonocardiales bacterium]|nr:eukaryotic-like serine/threonine-protein kinase [Pseudonocardiales bacterium]